MFALIPTGLKIVIATIALIGALGTLGYCQKQKINRLNQEVKKNKVILDNKIHKADRRSQRFIEQIKKEIRQQETMPKNQEKPNKKELKKWQDESFKQLRGIA